MIILGYSIPKSLQKNSFIISLDRQQHSRDLSKKQVVALISMLDIPLDFHHFDFDYSNLGDLKEDYELLLNKIMRNRMRTVKGWNKTIMAIQSIIDNDPDYNLIDDALGRIEYTGHWR